MGMRPLTFLTEEQRATWGNEDMEKIVEFYGSQQTHTDVDTGEITVSEAIIDKKLCLEEWKSIKTTAVAEQYPRDNLLNLWKLIYMYHREDIPNLMRVVTIAILHPIHTADVERTFSCQNMITTPLRNRLSA